MAGTPIDKLSVPRLVWLLAAAALVSIQTVAPAQDEDGQAPAAGQAEAKRNAPEATEAESAAAPTSGGPVSVPAHRFAERVVIVPIRGPIDQVTVRSVERRMEQAIAAGAGAIVFELDTPGGLADAALKLCTLIKSSPISNTVAWVNTEAYSAGTFIAMACREIVMAPYATIGDVAPILPGLIPIPAAERAKIESPLLAEIVDSARRRGYDERLAMSFVAVDIELWLVQNAETGDLLFVNRDEYRTIFGEEPSGTQRAQSSGGLPPPSGDVAPFFRSGGDPDQIEIPMTEEERYQEIELQQTLPSSRPELTVEDRGKYRFIEPVVDAHTLLVLKTEKAMRYGLATKVIANDQELKELFGATTLVRIEKSWSEGLVQLMTSMPVRLGLIVIFAIGLLWEMASPGVGLPGSIAAVALLALLGAPLLTGMAQWWAIALVIVGLALIGAEVFLIPGFGVAGVAGLLCLGVGFVGTFVAPDPGGGIIPTSPQGRESLTRGITALLLAIFAMAVSLYFAARHLGRLPGLGRLILAGTSADGDTMPTTLLQAMGPDTTGGPRVGDTGVALTDLRPVGRARIGGGIYDVVSGRGVIERNTPIRVVVAERFRTVVEADE